jgi:hypothetical protein
VAINPDNGNETLVATINSTGEKVEDAIYLPATNEVIGRDEDGANLIKINVTTKQVTKVQLAATVTSGFAELIVGKNSVLYALKIDVTNPDHAMQTLVKLDPKTGAATTVKGFEFNDDWESLVYIPANNEVVGLAGSGTKLFKVNLTSKDTSSVALDNTSAVQYRELYTDELSNLYGYKADYSDPVNYVAKIQNINPANGKQVLLSDLHVNKIHDNLLYVPQRKEVISIYDEIGLYRLNVETKTIVSKDLTTQLNITYGTLISN